MDAVSGEWAPSAPSGHCKPPQIGPWLRCHIGKCGDRSVSPTTRGTEFDRAVIQDYSGTARPGTAMQGTALQGKAW